MFYLDVMGEVANFYRTAGGYRMKSSHNLVWDSVMYIFSGYYENQWNNFTQSFESNCLDNVWKS